MATITEELVLNDKFSASFSRYIKLGNNAASASKLASNASNNYQTVLNKLDRQLITLNAQFEAAVQEQEAMAEAGKQNTREFAALDDRVEKLGSTIRNLSRQYDTVEQEATEAANAAEEFSKSNRRAESQAYSLNSALRSVAAGFFSFQGVKTLVQMSDEISNTTARLSMMDERLKTTDDLTNAIWQSAQRARGSYQETADFVSKLATLAGDAFSSDMEIVAFAEQINKQIKLSGASAQAASGALLQLTQGLSSGTLRGEELNSVLEQTPMVAQTIADYLGVTTGQMREMASEGQITAQVVKNAMFAAADETNAKFNELPMTWSDVWTQAKNIAVQALEPLLSVIGQVAQFVGNNLNTIVPIFLGLAAAVLVYTAAQSLATLAAQGFFVTLLANPIMWIAVAIGIIVARIYSWIQSVGGLQIAWLIVKNVILYALDTIKIGFFTAVYFVQDLWARMGLKILEVSVSIANWVGDMKAKVLTILQDMVNGAISLINQFIGLLNKIPGVSIEAIGEVTFGTEAALANEAEKQARNTALAASQEAVAQQLAEHEAALDQMVADRNSEFASRNAEIAALQAQVAAGSDSGVEDWYSSYPEYSSGGSGIGGSGGIGGDVSDIAGSTASIEKSVNMADEDLQQLIDMAEREYVNNINLTAQTPVITVNGANTGKTQADRKALADTIRDIILEQAAAGSTRSTARVYSGG